MEHSYGTTHANVRIRPLVHSDIELLRCWRNNPSNCRWLRQIPHITREMQEAWWEECLGDKNRLAFAIVEEGELRRCVGSLELRPALDNSCELASVMVGDAEAHGRGTGLNAVIAALDIAFFQLSAQRVWLHVFETNAAATRIYERAGFRIAGHTSAQEPELVLECTRAAFLGLEPGPGGTRSLEFAQLGDERGHLVVAEGDGADIPFEIKRVFYIYGSDADVVRGAHANRRTEFALINVAGSSRVRVDDGCGNERVYALDRPHTGVYIPRMVWKDMYGFSPDSVLLVLASEHYDATEYIRDWDEFAREVSS